MQSKTSMRTWNCVSVFLVNFPHAYLHHYNSQVLNGNVSIYKTIEYSTKWIVLVKYKKWESK